VSAAGFGGRKGLQGALAYACLGVGAEVVHTLTCICRLVLLHTLFVRTH
jgi:hypothetical protein